MAVFLLSVVVLMGLAMLHLPLSSAAAAQDWNPNLCLQEYAATVSGLDSSMTVICPALVRLKDCLLHSSLSLPAGPGENLTNRTTGVVERLVDRELRRHHVNCNPLLPRPYHRLSPLKPMWPDPPAMGRTKRTSHSIKKRSAVGIAARLALSAKTRKCVYDNLRSAVLDLDNFCENVLGMTTCALKGLTRAAAQALIPVLQDYLEELYGEYHEICNINVAEIMKDVLDSVKDGVESAVDKASDFSEDNVINPIKSTFGLDNSGVVHCLPHPWLTAICILVLGRVLVGFWMFPSLWK